jgi:hypothetical protein
MRPFSSQSILAFDADAVAAAVLRRGLGRPRLHKVQAASLPEGALEVSAQRPNLVRPAEVGEALRQAGEVFRGLPGAVTLVLPHGVTRTALLEVPGGAQAREYARFRLGPSLPYPLDEAIVDVLPLGGGRFLGSAVRRSIVGEYEEAVRSAGLRPGRVDLAPLAAAAGLRLHSPFGADPGIALVLGGAACAFVAFEGRQVASFRSRRRDRSPREATRLREEALRTAALAGLPGDPAIVVSGTGARQTADHLAAAGHPVVVVSLVPHLGPAHETASLPWLAAALA